MPYSPRKVARLTENYREVGSRVDDGLKSPGDLLEGSDGCTERQWVPHGSRLPRDKSAHRAGDDADAAFTGIATDAGRGGGVLHAANS